MSPEGLVLDIQRFSLHDGPGIRTTVFLKGCPLRCPWCHNPESWEPSPQVLFFADRCIGCGTCLEVCPVEEALRPGSEHRVNREACTACGRCAEQCPSGALELCGQRMSAGQVMEKVERDRPFYQTSGGGMTLSGGEPLAQPEFALSLLRLAAERDIGSALETCGCGEEGYLRKAAGLADLVLFDLKITDPAAHRRTVGAPNEDILRNLRAASAAGTPLVIRVPIVPGYTDGRRNLEEIYRLASSLGNVRRVELMRYNRLGESKWRRLGLRCPLQGTEAPEDERMEELRSILRSGPVEVTVSG